MAADITLATINARFLHSSFGLRYLMANLGPLQSRAKIIEWTLERPVGEMLEELLVQPPAILGLGVYIWNIALSTELVETIKRVRPEICIVLGGPEVSYENAELPIVKAADYVICGEADLAFAQLCQDIFAGTPPQEKILHPPLPTLDAVEMPYAFYNEEDIAHRLIYVEASRGCPFRCEFCLSSLELPVRAFPLEAFLAQMQTLLDRGVAHFKFVDRTFNLNLRVGRAILEFFLARYRPGLFLHFEMIPDRFPEGLRDMVQQFPPGALQFEVGIQTFQEEVSTRISRRQDNGKVEDNLRFLHELTGVHVHADLIIGLPGETVAQFAEGFDRLLGLSPQEIQVGILKRLRGTPIIRHDDEWQMQYSPFPPYEILQNRNIDYLTMQKLKRFARYWGIFGNSGNFLHSLPLLWTPQTQDILAEHASVPSVAKTDAKGNAKKNDDIVPYSEVMDAVALQKAFGNVFEEMENAAVDSPFWQFFALSEWLFAQLHRTHGLSLNRWMELFFLYLTTIQKWPETYIAQVLWEDYRRVPRPKIPAFLKPYIQESTAQTTSSSATTATSRQARHLAMAPSE